MLGFSLLAAAPAAAQDSSLGSFTVTPHVGYSVFGHLYDGPVTFVGAPPGANLQVRLAPKSQLTYGAGAGWRLGQSAWSLFADYARGSSRVQSESCGQSSCERSDDTDMTAWHVSAGVSRVLAVVPIPGVTTSLRVGGRYSRIRYGSDNDKVTLSNPGLMAGLDFLVPFAARAGVQLSLSDGVVRVDTDAFERQTRGSGEDAISLQRSYLNELTLAAGVQIRF